MRRRFGAPPAPIVAIGAGMAVAVLLPRAAPGSPDGAEWETATLADGCRNCHLAFVEPGSGPDSDKPVAGVNDAPDAALTIEGLPADPEPGRRYALTIRLRDAALENAGFLLAVRSAGAPAGKLEANDNRVETSGAMARSTWEGQWPDGPGSATWQLTWLAPEALEAPIELDLWGNAGNDDASPLGDTIHHSVLQLAVGH